MRNRCLYCYKELQGESSEFHTKCSKAFFGTPGAPELSLSGDQLEEWATQIVKQITAIPGVQPKLSLSLERTTEDPKKSRLTIMGLWGGFILKPQSPEYPYLPENEHLTMKLARLAGISTADHCLIRTSSGQLAYITKRFDRQGGKKVHVEDLCQISELPSTGRNKYNSTMEKTGRLIAKHSIAPGFDLQCYFEIVVFAFLTGNSDMHLKNFSIIRNEDNLYRLSPAYDLLSTTLALPEDKEQMAMPLNGKQSNIGRKDFFEFASRIKIDARIADWIITKQVGLIDDYAVQINASFLPEGMKANYVELMESRISLLKN